MLGKPNLVMAAEPPEIDPFPFVVAEAARLKGLGWQPRVDLQTGLSLLVKKISDKL